MTHKNEIWIDNDGCPAAVRELVLRGGTRIQRKIHVVGNSYPAKLTAGPLLNIVVVNDGFDAADNYIADHVAPGDLVITADIPLAQRVVTKNAVALNPRGEIYDAESISERFAVRNLMQELRSGGAIIGRSNSYNELDKKKFADALDRALNKLSRQ